MVTAAAATGVGLLAAIAGVSRPLWGFSTTARVGGGGRGGSRQSPLERSLARACAAGDCTRRACSGGGWAPVAYNDTRRLLVGLGARAGGRGGAPLGETPPEAAGVAAGEAELAAAAVDAVATAMAGVAGGPAGSASSPFPPRPPALPRQRYLVLTHLQGGFNNRLVAVKNALLLGAATGRVVVVDARRLGDAYDLPALFPGGGGGRGRKRTTLPPTPRRIR